MKTARLLTVVLFLVSLLLSACETAGPTTVTPVAVAPVATSTPANLQLWEYEPTDPNVPSLIENSPAISGTQGGALRIKPDWQVNTVEYVYEQIFMTGSAFEDITVSRDGSGYKISSGSIDQANVAELIAALAHLYPSQSELTHSSHTDDYPHWRAEIVGADGQHILLTSNSNDNPGYGPWNVLYNGRLYAQYDGAVGVALGKLFGDKRLANGQAGDPISNDTSGQVQFGNGGLPPQLLYGFWGLLPLSDGFSYSANVNNGAITGQFSGGSLGSEDRDEINKLNNIELTADGAKISCTIVQQPEPDGGDTFTPQTPSTFTCPLTGASLGQSYRYPISISLSTSDGKTAVISGELNGDWRDADVEANVLLPAPPEIAAAFAANPITASVLSDHILGMSNYTGELPASDPLKGTRNGEAVLFGATTVDGRPVHYTVSAQFAITDGKLDYWTLDRTNLSLAVGLVLRQPLTKRVVEADPNVVVNVWFADSTPPQTGDNYSFERVEPYAMSLNSCAGTPGGMFPASDQPLIAFGYNFSPYFPRYSTTPFVIVNERTVVAALMFDAATSAAGRILYTPLDRATQDILWPDALKTGNNRPFASISIQNAPYNGGPQIQILLPENPSADELAAYEQVIAALPLAASKDEAAYTISGASLAVGDDGKLNVVPCKEPTPLPPTLAPGAEQPHLVYSTFYGSTDASEDASTSADSIAVDSMGNMVIAGMTSSKSLPTRNAFKPNYSASLWDGFLATLNPDSGDLVLATYFGSGSETTVEGLATDQQGNIYLTGSARRGFQVQNSPIQAGIKGDADAYVMKISREGQVVYAGLLGGTEYDTGQDIAVDDAGNVYLVGTSRSTDFPTKAALQDKIGGGDEGSNLGDAFVAKLGPDGALLYSTYLGGSGGEVGQAIAVDSAGAVYIAGGTSSADFPLNGALQTKLAGDADAFVGKVSPDGGKLVYSTYLGGSGGKSIGTRTNGDNATDIALDKAGNAYVVGVTPAADFPLKNALSKEFNGGVLTGNLLDGPQDAFVSELNADGSALLFSSYFGGSSSDSASSVGLDAAGNIYVGGSTSSSDLPLLAPLQSEFSDKNTGLAPDSFIVKLKPDGAGLVYSTYLGGDGFDALADMTVDSTGNVYISGSVDKATTGFPLAGKSFQTTNSGIRSAFVAKISTDQP